MSKCFNIIERFSEDIDLVVIRHEGEKDAKLKNKIREVSKAVESVLPEVAVEGITRKRGMNRKTAHSYSKEFSGEYGQVRDTIIIEATWLGSTEPNTAQVLSSYIYEMMKARGQLEMADRYDLLPFNVQVLDIRRTLCEKIMSLVRFSYSDDPITDLGNKIRHTYDLHLLLAVAEIQSFFESEHFDELIKKVAREDAESFRNNNEWLRFHPVEATMFRDIETVWESLSTIYERDFQYLVYGEFPKSEEILSSLEIVKARLGKLEWHVDFSVNN